jgi:hypothetical protein
LVNPTIRDSGLPTQPAASRGAFSERERQCDDSRSDPVQVALVAGVGTRLGPAASFATTKHVTLQTARSMTVAVALSLQQHHRRREHEACTPEGVDRGAIFVPASQPADPA